MTRTKFCMVALFTLFTVLIITPQFIRAEEPRKSIELGEIVVTATKIEKKIQDISVPVTIISQEEIQKTDARNIEEVLQNVPGIFTEDKYHAQYNVVSFRGVGLHTHVTRGVLVLVDGIAINEASGRVDFEGIDLENVEKVEVLKGPVSALYGPNGITGVINIMTKKAPEDLEAKVKASIGSYQTHKISANIGGRKGKFGFRLHATDYYSDGYRIYNSYANDAIGAKVDVDLDEYGKLLFSTDFITSDKDVTGTLNEAQYQARSNENTKFFAKGDIDIMRFGATHNKHWGELFETSTSFYLRNKKHAGGYADNFTAEDELDLIGGEIRLQTLFDLWSRSNSLIFGISHDIENGNSKTFDLDASGNKSDLTDEGQSDYKITGFYFENNYNLFDPLTLTFGIRYDSVSYDWQDRFLSDGDSSATKEISAWSPKIGLAYSPKETLTFFGNISRGFNPPQIEQLFIDGSTLSNPDLKPEYLSNYEVGLRGQFLKMVDYQASFFLMNFKDQAVEDEVTGRYENVGDTRHKGIETTVNIYLPGNLTLSANYAYLLAEFINYSGYNGNEIAKTPNHQLGAGLTYSHYSGFTGNINLKWIDKYFMDNEEVNVYEGHCVVNTKLSYRWKRYYSSLSINNLFDTKYATWSSASYRAGNWTNTYYPGWPLNVTFTLGAEF